MADPRVSRFPRPRDSWFVRVLLYFGEGAILGAVLYVITEFVVLSGGLVGTGDVGLVVIWIIVLSIGTGRVILVYYVTDDSEKQPRSQVEEEWKAIRRWPWVLAVAVIVLGGFIGVSGMLTDEEWWLSSNARFLSLVTLLVGVILRFAVAHLCGTDNDTISTG